MEDKNLEKQELNFDSKNPYIVLQINEDASKTEIKKAYKTLAKSIIQI